MTNKAWGLGNDPSVHQIGEIRPTFEYVADFDIEVDVESQRRGGGRDDENVQNIPETGEVGETWISKRFIFDSILI